MKCHTLFFSKIRKHVAKFIGTAKVVIGALRVNMLVWVPASQVTKEINKGLDQSAHLCSLVSTSEPANKILVLNTLLSQKLCK